MNGFDTAGFVGELHRRRVFQVVALYIVGAWIVLQMAELAFQAAGIDEGAIRYVWFGALTGFPIALVLGWRFDLVDGRIVHTPPVGRADVQELSLQRSDYAILATLALVVVTTTYGLVIEIQKMRELGEEIAEPPSLNPQGIAVLPFIDASAGGEKAEFLALGLQDGLITSLARIGDLHVISRTSVNAYRDTDKNIREIAGDLGVSKILEGSVQRSDEQIHVNVQLIDASSDKHLWAERYDRAVTGTDIFAIQNEIVTQIAGTLKTKLTEHEIRVLNTVPTRHMGAYQAYTLGRQRMATRNTEALAQALEQFKRAIALDPEFAAAYAALADTYLLIHRYSAGADEDLVKLARSAVQQALALNDQLGEAHASLGAIRLFYNKYEGAEKALLHAIALNPHHAPAYHYYAFVLDAMDRREDALNMRLKAVELDPLSIVYSLAVGLQLQALGRADEAMEYFRRAELIDPTLSIIKARIAGAEAFSRGRLDRAVPAYIDAVDADPGSPAYPSLLALMYLNLGDELHAQAWIDHALAMQTGGGVSSAVASVLALYRGDAAGVIEHCERQLQNSTHYGPVGRLRTVDLEAGRETEALDRYSWYFPGLVYDPAPAINDDNYLAAIDFALVLLRTGDEARARWLLDKSYAHMQTRRRLGTNGYGIADVAVHAMEGRTEEALAALRSAIDEGWRIGWWYYLERDPNLESLHNNPRYQMMVEEIRADMAAQLSRVIQMERRGKIKTVAQLGSE